jgi:hypothetical protein
LTQVGQLFTLFVLFLADSLQSLRQIRNVRAEMFDRLQAVLEVTEKKERKNNDENGYENLFSPTRIETHTDRQSINPSIIWISGAHQSHDGALAGWKQKSLSFPSAVLQQQEYREGLD